MDLSAFREPMEGKINVEERRAFTSLTKNVFIDIECNTCKVNYFAMMQVTNTFLPMFKSQSCEGTYSNCRIINVVFMAGLTPLSGPYSGSKFAAEVFSNILRQELKSFNK